MINCMQCDDLFRAAGDAKEAVPEWVRIRKVDIAIADIDGNGQPDSIVFHIDNPGGENHAN
jgi:hypothetical protein